MIASVLTVQYDISMEKQEVRSVEIRTLRYFLAIVQEGSITKAAEMLHITQPTLSRQMMDNWGGGSIGKPDTGLLYEKIF